MLLDGSSKFRCVKFVNVSKSLFKNSKLSIFRERNSNLKMTSDFKFFNAISKNLKFCKLEIHFYLFIYIYIFIYIIIFTNI